MARGPALTQDILPILEEHLTADLDAYASGRLQEMRSRYASFFERASS
jgi:hypothetical protein